MNIKSILSKYPELAGKLIDTIDENMKLFISNEDYKLYVMLNANKSFVLKEQNDTKSFENLSDVNEYISNKYPLKKGDICEDMNWLGNKIKIVAANNKVFVYADENGRYGIAYSALHVGRNSLYNDISLGQALKIAREDFGLVDDEFLYSDENKIYSIAESNPDYIVLHNLTDKDYEFVKGSDWLTHEAFCLYGEADKFKPYEKLRPDLISFLFHPMPAWYDRCPSGRGLTFRQVSER